MSKQSVVFITATNGHRNRNVHTCVGAMG